MMLSFVVTSILVILAPYGPRLQYKIFYYKKNYFVQISLPFVNRKKGY